MKVTIQERTRTGVILGYQVFYDIFEIEVETFEQATEVALKLIKDIQNS